MFLVAGFSTLNASSKFSLNLQICDRSKVNQLAQYYLYYANFAMATVISFSK